MRRTTMRARRVVVRRPGLEGLEARALLAGDTIAVPFAEALVTSQAMTTSGVAAVPDGDFYVSGLFQGTVDFDPGPGVHEVTRTVQETGVGDGFLAKYSARGDLLWVRTFAVPQGENLRVGDVATSGDGDRVVLVGSATAGVDLDPGPGTADGTLGAFVADVRSGRDLPVGRAVRRARPDVQLPERRGGGSARATRS